MWLSSLRVFRFGPFHDWSLSGLKPGLNILFGPNESGKTTIMQFLRGMLFGFTKTSFDLHNGSDLAGTLNLVDDQGQEWHLERRGRGKKALVQLSGPGGSSPGEMGLSQLLHEVSRTTYENIYAFGLGELQNLASLQHQDVKQHLYSASLGLGPVRLKEVEKGLDKELENLFKPRGEKQEINLILEELGAIHRTIQTLGQEPEEFQHLTRDLARLEGEVARLEQERQQVQKQVQWGEKLSQAWEVFQERRQAAAELKGLPVIETFPEEGVPRLEALKATLEEVEGDIARRQRELAQTRESAARLVPDARLLDAASALDTLLEDRALFEKDREEQDKATRARLTGESRLAEALAHLGPEWSAERVKACDASLATRTRLQGWQQELEEAKKELDRAGERRSRQQDATQIAQAAWEQGQSSGPSQHAGRIFFWAWPTLILVLGLSALLVYLWGPPVYAGLLGVAAGMALLAALVSWGQLWAAFRRRSQELAASLNLAQAALREAEGELARQTTNHQGLLQDWEAFLKEAALPSNLPPQGALDFLGGVEKARGLLEEIQTMVQTLKDREGRLERFIRQVNEVLTATGRPPASGEELSLALARLKQDLAEARRMEEDQRQAIAKIASLEGELDSHLKKRDRKEGERQRLLAAAGTGEEEEFLQRAKLYSRRVHLQGELNRLTQQLAWHAGGGPALEQMEEDLDRTNWQDLQTLLEQRRGRQAELEQALAEARRQQGGVQKRLEQLERTEELSQALLKEQTLLTRFQQAAWRWAVLKMASKFLQTARKRFELECQPPMHQRAGRYFELVTEGRYRQVFAPLEEDAFLVVDQEGSQVPVERLSRGTAEQLYLALRFAFIQEYSRGGKSLPLILDDILVNFDDTRARQAVRLLNEMAASHQLLVFTCHRPILGLIQEVLGPQAPAPVELLQV